MRSYERLDRYITGRYLKNLRVAINLKVSVVARTLGVSSNRIVNWEIGHPVPRKFIKPLANLYKVDPRTMARVFYNFDLIKLKAKWGIIKNGAIADYYKRIREEQNNRPVKISKVQSRKRLHGKHRKRKVRSVR